MRAVKTISITLAPELLVQAQTFAEREHRTLDEVFGEALNRYMTSDAEWQALLKRVRAQGMALGIQSEDDVERLSDEFRREQR